MSTYERVNVTTEIVPMIETTENVNKENKIVERGFKEMVADKVTLQSFLDMQQMLKQVISENEKLKEEIRIIKLNINL